MDEITRLTSDVTQLTRRVDDFSMRLAVVEVQVKNFDEKLDDIKAVIERWNKIGFWLITLVGGLIITAFLQFAMSGGLQMVQTAKAYGGF